MDSFEQEFIYGKNAVTELLKGDFAVDTVYIAQSMNDKVAAYYEALAKDCGAVVKRVHSLKLNTLAKTENHQGVVASAASVEYKSVAELLAAAKEKNEPAFIVVADGVEDPHNLGAIIRTAYLCGAQGVVIPKRGGVSVTPIVHKASAGAAAILPIARVANIGEAVRILKQNNVFIYASDMSGQELHRQNLSGAIAIVVGGEGSGVSPLVKKLCDGLIRLSMSNAGTGIDSFNVSVASGIILYEVQRAR